MKILKIVLIMAGILLLAGCGMDESTAAKKAAAKPIPQNCNHWCHNGWCSTHCEDVVAS
ncbi:MAG: hypothetical protein Q8L78_06220 [Coxiellaceae bacterium]|nr:hypothetical protein [Coxiellaceae bacterium]